MLPVSIHNEAKRRFDIRENRRFCQGLPAEWACFDFICCQPLAVAVLTFHFRALRSYILDSPSVCTGIWESEKPWSYRVCIHLQKDFISFAFVTDIQAPNIDLAIFKCSFGRRNPFRHDCLQDSKQADIFQRALYPKAEQQATVFQREQKSGKSRKWTRTGK